MKSEKALKNWRIAYWSLFAGWVIGAALNMNHVDGGFLTNYLADLLFPPWFYIYIRGLSNPRGIPRLLLVGHWFGQTPERAAISIFSIGTIAELKTMYWPGGPFAGTFDAIDIIAYATGLLICYLCDRRSSAKVNTSLIVES